ncbi:glycosyltransferase [Corynebacterium sp.]|uniref:glycosyltransferase n=1 Tax=Corynebacterium sp. TaxID=1720 RepID=UPI0026DBAF56|nr:glycosyltransferase [Corynebacterium sp.]MDO5077877.1 glycosyltransferase [Corynebacterium sp.]
MLIRTAIAQTLNAVFTLARMVPLALKNRFRTARIPRDGEVTISLTTHGRRLASVHYSIESVAHSGVPIVLWLDRAEYESPWPEPLVRLVRRGLQVRCSTGNFGPHTKYWGQFQRAQGRVVTIDDDIIYPKRFLERLLAISDVRGDAVVAYRAHRIELRDGKLLPYAKWTPVDTCEASVLHFATGVSGVLYPKAFIDYVVEQGTAFMETCPRADDVWLHACALRSGFPVRQVFAQPRHFAIVPFTFGGALVMQNAFLGGNDEQIAKVYTPADIAQLQRASELED